MRVFSLETQTYHEIGYCILYKWCDICYVGCVSLPRLCSLSIRLRFTRLECASSCVLKKGNNGTSNVQEGDGGMMGGMTKLLWL